jgi:ribosome-binding protein aMBF1 (putative translation factor)
MVQTARRKKEWTVKTLIERLGGDISPAYITQIERHDQIPTPTLTVRLAEVLGIDLMTLVEAAKHQQRIKFNKALDRRWDINNS